MATEGTMDITKLSNNELDAALANDPTDELHAERIRRITLTQRAQREDEDVTIRRLTGNQLYVIGDSLACIEEGDGDEALDVGFIREGKTQMTMTVRLWLAVADRIDPQFAGEQAAEAANAKTRNEWEFAARSAERAAEALLARIDRELERHWQRHGLGL